MYPPEDDWYDYYTQKIIEKQDNFVMQEHSLETIGLAVKAGSILPLKPIRKLSSLKTLKDPFFLDIYPTLQDFTAKGWLYMDDGESYDFQRKDAFDLYEFKLNSDFSLEIVKHKNNYQRKDNGMILDFIVLNNMNRKPQMVQRKQGEIWKDVPSSAIGYHSEKKKLILRDLGINLYEVEEGTVISMLFESYRIDL